MFSIGIDRTSVLGSVVCLSLFLILIKLTPKDKRPLPIGSDDVVKLYPAFTKQKHKRHYFGQFDANSHKFHSTPE